MKKNLIMYHVACIAAMRFIQKKDAIFAETEFYALTAPMKMMFP